MSARPSVSLRATRGRAVVRLAAGELEADYVPELGMLGAALRHRGDDVLALPGGLPAYANGHTTGLPILAPWANRLGAPKYTVGGVTVDVAALPLHRDPNGLPIHGTMTAQPGWEVTQLGTRDDAAALTARFDYGARPDLLEAFPFPHELTIDARLGAGRLRVTTTLRATGRRPVPVSFGYHPYLRLPGVSRRGWWLDLPRCTRLVLDDTGLPTGETEPAGPIAAPLEGNSLDDLFALGARRWMALVGGGRQVTVNFESGYAFAQVFAPPGKQFACLEPMTAPVNALVDGGCSTVAPGESFSARFSISVTDL
jgi:galactose mutarotase-like enzyme